MPPRPEKIVGLTVTIPLDFDVTHSHYAVMTLDKYLSEHSITSAQFAKLVGVDRAYITRLRNGVGNPTKSVMERIIAQSGGKVTANDFFAPAEIEGAPV